MTAVSAGRYLRHNRRTSIPRTFVYLDTEARRVRDGASEIQSFRCAVAAVDRRNHHDGGWCEREWAEFMAPDVLWKWVEQQVPAKGRLVVVAHNLGYDLRIGQAFRWLPAAGWELRAIRLEGPQAWATWRRGRQTIQMCDSLSWVNVSLERLGEACGIRKLDLPDWSDHDEQWLERCHRDVEILAEAWRRLMEWVVGDDLGNWRPTGAGQSWSAFRHRFLTHTVKAHHDDVATGAERLAAFTGRCEAWRHGVIDGGPFVEWDMSRAYAQIGRECGVPVHLCGLTDNVELGDVVELADTYAVLSEVVVSTEVACVPARHDGRIVWPVGTFATTLWDTEIALAVECGARVVPSRCWTYRREPALAEFCGWVLDRLDGVDGNVDLVVEAALKHWSRALIGRFAARWSSWETFGEVDTDDVFQARMVDAGAGTDERVLQVGRRLLRATAERDAPDSVPAVMSWVMAECRRRLWHLMEAAGFDHVVYVDTDAVIVDQAGHDALLSAVVPGVRVKGQWSALRVFGPRQIAVQGLLRAAGVPRGVRLVDDEHAEGTVWAGLGTSLAVGEHDSVRLVDRAWHLRGTDERRRHVGDGRTEPLRLTVGSQLP